MDLQKEQQIEPVNPAELQRARANYMRLQEMHNDLAALNKKIYAIDKTIQKLNRQLKTLENSFVDKVLHVVYAVRGTDGEIIRLISARPATKKEREAYYGHDTSSAQRK